MNLSDIWAKMAVQKPLSPAEMVFLKNAGRETQLRNTLVAGWGNGASSIYVDKVNAKSTFFEQMPNSYIAMIKTADTTIADNTETAVTTFDAMTSTTNEFFEADATNGRIYCKQPGRVYGFHIFNSWTANATGHRAGLVNLYNKEDDSLISFNSMYRVPAVTGNTTDISSVAFRIWESPYDAGDYAVMNVYQNSTGNLALKGCTFGAFVIR